jgi:DNA invertase Pin-like site-specific DNA recombinase
MAGVFAQLERAMIRLRQREGIEAAKKAGKYHGGKKRFDPAAIRQMSATGGGRGPASTGSKKTACGFG